MGHASTLRFRTLHSLRVRGFATVDDLAESTALAAHEIEAQLAELKEEGIVLFRERRSLWQLTPEGRSAHPDALAADAADAPLDRIAPLYAAFLAQNTTFKELCGDWQLRGGVPNDHTDAAHDAAVLERFGAFSDESVPIVADLGAAYERFAPYAPRLAGAAERVLAGDIKQLTGVMCGSFHDVWMELHEDLLLTQGIERSAEGSF